MPLDPLRIGEHLHGHLGWLAVLALAHPAILLRNHRRRAHLSVGLAVGISTLAAALGIAAERTPWPDLDEDEVNGLVEKYASPEWLEGR